MRDFDVVPWCTAADVEQESDPFNDASLMADAIQVASNILYRLVGFQYVGVRDVSIRVASEYVKEFGTVIDFGVTVNSVASITVDGDLVPSSAYRVDNARLVRRIDGFTWPSDWTVNEGLNRSYDEFLFVGNVGDAPPVEGRYAAALLAAEIYKSYRGKPCRLPDRVQTYTRQGVSATVINPIDFLDGWRTGLNMVDMFLATHNPGKRRAPYTGMADPERPKRSFSPGGL